MSKKILAFTSMLCAPLLTFAQGIDSSVFLIGTLWENIEGVLDAIFDAVFFTINFPVIGEHPFVLIWLVIGALFFTIYNGFVNFWGFKHALDVVRGKYDDPSDPGEVSHFQALATALSGTVGVGNIAGVALAISLGGAGATFWIILVGLLGMSSKFVECTLGLKYRKQLPDGSVSGGPMYYLSEGLAKRGVGGLGKVLAVLFAIACIGGSFGGGNMVQINQATSQLVTVTGGEGSFFFGNEWIFGACLLYTSPSPRDGLLSRMPSSA